MSEPLPPLTIVDTVAAIAGGTTTAVQVVQRCLDTIGRVDPLLNCMTEVFAEEALKRASEIDGHDDPGSIGPLAGVPIAIKDNIATTIGCTTCCSKMLQGYRSPFDATAVERLQEAGAIIIGKTNCDEFAMGSSTEHSVYGPTCHPWDLDRVPGGSSGGSAAAVTAGCCVAALGSDTGGSIRQPAALCGCVGLKPSYGRVSRYGLVAFGSSLDQIGPLTNTVEDAAIMLSVIAGFDHRDSTSLDAAGPSVAIEDGLDPRTLRIGIVKEYQENNDPDVTKALEEVIDVYRSLGATIVDVELPIITHGIATYYVIAPAEASSNLARFDGIRYGHRSEMKPDDSLEDFYCRTRGEGFGDEVQRRVMLGTYVLSSGYYDAYYNRALQVRRLIKDAFDDVFATCDVLLGPTTPSPAFAIGEKCDPMSMYLCDIYTAGTNISGHCGISIPGGFCGGEGGPLPIGMQLQAPVLAEETLLQAAAILQNATDHHLQRPELSAESTP
jgi:aspartyl-tRNA(Asn)/glutamyl-tRNA(Gln) amidotransferase subunit A